MIVLMIGASYAYFSITRISVNTNISGTTDIVINLDNPMSISFNVNPYIPFSSELFDESNEITSTANLTNNTDAYLTCYYDIMYIPKSGTDTFVVSPANTSNLQELVIVGTDESGQNSNFSYNLVNKPFNNGEGYKIMTAAISANNDGVKVTSSWKFKVAYYNLDLDQTINAGKTIQGEIAFELQECINSRTALTIVNNLVGSSNTDSNSLAWTVKNEKGLRYQGKNPDNYICFDTDGVCSPGQLYRIVGVLDDEGLDGSDTFANSSTLYTSKILKIMKSTYYEDAVFGPSGDWLTSSIRDSMNTSYLTTYTTNNIKDKILYTKWYLCSDANGSGPILPSYMYERERDGIVWPGRARYSFDKLGLIYGSDLLLASHESGSCNHNIEYTSSNAGNCQPYNYMFGGGYSWAITPAVLDPSAVRYYRASTGVTSGAEATNSYRYHPTFHILANLPLSGSGTTADPYVIVSQ